MVGFRTVTGKTYYVNQYQRLFYGEEIQEPLPYVQCSAIIGAPGFVQFIDGSTYQTDIVQAYI